MSGPSGGLDAGEDGPDAAGADGGPDPESDGASAGPQKQARVLSVAPAYTVAEETYKYRPKASSAQQPVWKVDQGPKGLGVSDDGTSVSWTPSADQKGKHDYSLKAQVGDEELTQGGAITVAVSEERAAVDVDEKSAGSAIVTAPKSKVRGAAVATKPGAVKGQTRLTVSEVDSAPSMGITKGEPRAVQFGPSGTVFADPALITLPLPEGAVDDPQRVGAFVYDPKGRWVRVPVVSVDSDKGVVHAKAKHFSLYAAGESKLGLALSATLAPEAGACAGSLFASAWVEEPLSELEAAEVAHLSDVLVARAADGKLATLLAQEGVSGSLRVVRVVELGQGEAGSRVVLETRLLVTTLYLKGDGSAEVTHTDALGNRLGSFHFDAVQGSLATIWTHLSGRALRAVFQAAPTGPISLSARLHALYFSGDASLDPVSADDLGFALVDSGELVVQKPANDARDADLDCDGLIKAYDAMDDRLLPHIEAQPSGVVGAVAGQPVQLSARLVNAPEAAPSWQVLAGQAALDAVAGDPNARAFKADEPGRYLVEVGAEVDGETLSTVFAIDVSAQLPLPKCVPSPDRGVLKQGEAVGLSAVLDESSFPSSSLELKWGALLEGNLVPLTGLEARGAEARFTPASAGRYTLACRVVQGERQGALGDTSVDVLPAQSNLPPTDLTLSPSYETLLVGAPLTFVARARDPEAAPLQFGWRASGGSLGTPQSSGSDSRVSFSAAQPGLYQLWLTVEDAQRAQAEAQAFVLVVANAADTEGADADGDGWPARLDCDDQNPKVNPGAVDRCGDSIDDDCSGAAATTDCDDDGYSVEQGDCDDAAREVNPRALERCDAIDNDCDGQRDEGFSVGKSCSVGMGQCASTSTWVCSADGFGAFCPATPLRPAPEVCDGVDNDCDGALDEDYTPRPVTCGVGACGATGVSACVAGKEQNSCTPGAPAVADLDCDGVDDDCNGQIDEDVIKLAEVCNGRDDNCDARIDEGLACTSTPPAGCTPQGNEQCNGLDDDCDGRFDEDAVCGSTAPAGSLLGVFWDCADPACTSLGEGGMMFLADGTGIKLESFDQRPYDPARGPYCVSGPFQYSVNGDQVSLSWLENGDVPHSAQGSFSLSGAYLSVNFSSGPSDMLGSHALVRTPEQPGGACPQGPVCQPNEVCGNGFDDNCDGKDDKSDPACVTCTGTQTPEICDQLDNDCNGTIDDLASPCVSETSQGVCRNGKLVCPQQGSQPVCAAGTPDVTGEVCPDGLDNDCDGVVDEAGCAQLTAGETCFNAIDASLGGVFTLPRGARNDVRGTCRPDHYVDRVLFLRTPAGLSPQYVINVDSSVKMDVGGTLYKVPAEFVAGGACPPIEGLQTYCVGGGRGGTTQMATYLEPNSTYLLLVEATPDIAAEGGSIRVSIARNNDGQCTPGDGDGDGVSICAGDCDDSSQATHTGATELCNQQDDDCDGLVDEQEGTCATGLPGVCGLGLTQCNQTPTCQPIQRSTRDYCGDAVDNDCNGAVDDNCVAAAGESCENAVDLGVGGPASGTLTGATDDAVSRCGLEGAERFYRFSVPAGGAYVQLRESSHPGATSYSLYQDCAETVVRCGFKAEWLEQGSYVLAVEGAAGPSFDYAFTLAIGDGTTCITPDLDGDGKLACDDDCDEARATVHAGASEGTSCDGRDDDCNGWVDDVQASCSVPGLQGVCAAGALRCDARGTGGGSCQQVAFPDALGRDACGDGLDNDCDGAADTQDAQGCVSLPAGDVCGLAYQGDISALGNFAGSLAGYGDDVELGCGDYGTNAVERFYTVILSQPRVLRIDVRSQVAGDTGYVGLAMLDGCASSMSAGGVQCGSGSFSRELAAGTYTFAVFGPAGRDYTLLVSTTAPGDFTGASCQPPDLDGDGATLCNADCWESNAAIHPGAVELCDNLDNDCDMMVDEDIPGSPCSVNGAQGVCAQGMLKCTQGAMVCTGPQPGQQPELCNDGRDNDCDGMADDTGTPGVDCQQLSGESCQDALPFPGGFIDGSLFGAKHDGNGCYGGTEGLAEDRYYAFNVPTPGYYYLQLRPMGAGPFPPHSVGIFKGACGPDMPNDGCSMMGGNVVWYYLSQPGPHFVMVESDEPFNYRIGLATTDAGGACTLPDGDGDGYDFCEYDCEDQNPSVHPGASELCNGIDDNCDGVIDDGC